MRAVTTRHNAPDEMLLAYATGWLNEPLSLIVESHAAYSEDSRARLGDFEAIGGLLLEEMAPAPLTKVDLESLLERLDEQPAAGEAAPAPAREAPRDGFELPAALRRYVGDDIGALTWKPLMRGVTEAEIGSPDESGARIRLLRIEAGTTVPRHSHRGQEYALVLSGAYRDDGAVFGPGDLQLADPAVDHRPQALGEAPCLCLVVTDAPLRLTGPLGRLLDPFVKGRL